MESPNLSFRLRPVAGAVTGGCCKENWLRRMPDDFKDILSLGCNDQDLFFIAGVPETNLATVSLDLRDLVIVASETSRRITDQ